MIWESHFWNIELVSGGHRKKLIRPSKLNQGYSLESQVCLLGISSGTTEVPVYQVGGSNRKLSGRSVIVYSSKFKKMAVFFLPLGGPIFHCVNCALYHIFWNIKAWNSYLLLIVKVINQQQWCCLDVQMFSDQRQHMYSNGVCSVVLFERSAPKPFACILVRISIDLASCITWPTMLPWYPSKNGSTLFVLLSQKWNKYVNIIANVDRRRL